MYIFVRQDIPLQHQLVQSNHASLTLASYRGVEGVPNVVVLGVPDEPSLCAVRKTLVENQIPHCAWQEPDAELGLGFTAIATAPVEGAERRLFQKYRLWTHAPVAQAGRASDSNSAG